jgi:hypothetical protein
MILLAKESIASFVDHTSPNPKYWNIKHGRSKPSHQNTTKNIKDLLEKGLDNHTAKHNENLLADVPVLT